jgi:hypothetical protein
LTKFFAWSIIVSNLLLRTNLFALDERKLSRKYVQIVHKLRECSAMINKNKIKCQLNIYSEIALRNWSFGNMGYIRGIIIPLTSFVHRKPFFFNFMIQKFRL